jgi:hypothetical protein
MFRGPVHNLGCWKALLDWIPIIFIGAGILAIIVSVILLLTFALSLCLCFQIRKNKKGSIPHDLVSYSEIKGMQV